jgi:hypothetical protein
MATLADLEEDDKEPAPRATLADLSDDETSAPSKSSKPAVPAESPWYSSVARGLKDPVTGAGQLLQNILPDQAANWFRRPETTAALGGVSPIIPAAATLLVGAGGGAPTTTEAVNRGIASDEAAFQAQRKAAGKEGLDWWRVGGNVANPLSWAGGAGGATVGQAAARGAGTGALQALMQPVTEGDSYAMSKATQTAIGAGAGGILGAAFHGLGRGISEVVKAFKSKGGEAADEATQVLLRKEGADPAAVNPSVYNAIRQEVDDAMAQGVDPNPRVMFNRADAGSLPVPVQLTRGQAARDPMQYSWEVNSGKLKGAGEPLSQMLDKQNRQLIENLNVLGARNAPSTFDASKQLIGHIETVDAGLKSKINEAYALVRDSAGRSARVSNEEFSNLAVNALTEGKPELRSLVNRGDLIPAKIRDVYNDIVSGKLPLTVDTVQFLDRNWGAVQRAASSDEAMAIGTLRRALNETPVSDALGQESMAAYKAAKTLAKQRFDLIDSNAAYKAVIEQGVEPDKFFQKYVQGSNVSELGQLKRIIGPENSQLLQRTFLGRLKDQVLNHHSDENGIFSESKLNNVLKDPVQAPRLKELFAENPAILEQLNRLGRVSENILYYPKGHSVNTSNTAPTLVNTIRDVAKSEAGASLWNMIPFARPIREVSAQRAAGKAVSEAMNPGVTAAPLPKLAPPAQMSKLSDLVTRVGAAGAARELGEKRKERAKD